MVFVFMCLGITGLLVLMIVFGERQNKEWVQACGFVGLFVLWVFVFLFVSTATVYTHNDFVQTRCACQQYDSLTEQEQADVLSNAKYANRIIRRARRRDGSCWLGWFGNRRVANYEILLPEHLN